VRVAARAPRLPAPSPAGLPPRARRPPALLPGPLRARNPRLFPPQVLTYHVHAGAVYASQLSNGETVSTLDGAQVLTVSINGNVVKINAAEVIRANLNCS